MKDYKREIAYWNNIRAKGIKKWHENKRKRQAIVEGGKEGESSLSDWYEERLKQTSGRCVECGCRIVFNEKMKFWSICHLLPKNLFPSIATNKDNWIELCNECHTRYDDSWMNVLEMRILNLILVKYQLFKDCIADDEKRRIPYFFNEEIISK